MIVVRIKRGNDNRREEQRNEWSWRSPNGTASKQILLTIRALVNATYLGPVKGRASIVTVFILIACGGSGNYAPDRNFYFEVVSSDSSGASGALGGFLREEIPKHKYTITRQSGLTWPFYRELGLNEKIARDSLMPPHWFVHRMVPYRNGESIRKDEYLVRIYVMPDPKATPNYSIDIFRMDSTGLTLSGRADIHYIDSSEFRLQGSVYDLYLKSVVRYSFK